MLATGRCTLSLVTVALPPLLTHITTELVEHGRDEGIALGLALNAADVLQRGSALDGRRLSGKSESSARRASDLPETLIEGLSPAVVAAVEKTRAAKTLPTPEERIQIVESASHRHTILEGLAMALRSSNSSAREKAASHAGKLLGEGDGDLARRVADTIAAYSLIEEAMVCVSKRTPGSSRSRSRSLAAAPSSAGATATAADGAIVEAAPPVVGRSGQPVNYSESKHPRVGKGRHGGGQFAHGQGGQGQGAQAPSSQSASLQRRLRTLGYDVSVSGRDDPKTSSSLADFQKQQNLPPTGKLDPSTIEALRNPAPLTAQQANAELTKGTKGTKKVAAKKAATKKTTLTDPWNIGKGEKGPKVAALQDSLGEFGFNIGDAYGTFDKDTEESVRRFQKQVGIQPTGKMDSITRTALLTANAKSKSDTSVFGAGALQASERAAGIKESAPPLPDKPGINNWVEKAGGLPNYIDRIARHLFWEKHMSESHAIATAVNVVKRWCAGGTVSTTHGPTVTSHVTAKTRAEACAAVASWEAKRATTKAGKAAKAVSHAISEVEELIQQARRDGVRPPSLEECAEILEAVERERELEESVFDPSKHPRDPLGRFTSVLMHLRVGQTMLLSTGKNPTAVTRLENITGGKHDRYKVYGGREGGPEVVMGAKDAAVQAMERAFGADVLHPSETLEQKRKRMAAYAERQLLHQQHREDVVSTGAVERHPRTDEVGSRKLKTKMVREATVERVEKLESRLQEAVEERQRAAEANDTTAFVTAQACERALRLQIVEVGLWRGELHPRNRIGQFRDVLGKLAALGTGNSAHFALGAHARQGGQHTVRVQKFDGGFRVHTAHASQSFATADEAAAELAKLYSTAQKRGGGDINAPVMASLHPLAGYGTKAATMAPHGLGPSAIDKARTDAGLGKIKPTTHSGVYYFKSPVEAREYASAHGHPTDRIIPYERGYAIQLGVHGSYVGPSGTGRPAEFDVETAARQRGTGRPELKGTPPSPLAGAIPKPQEAWPTNKFFSGNGLLKGQTAHDHLDATIHLAGAISKGPGLTAEDRVDLVKATSALESARHAKTYSEMRAAADRADSALRGVKTRRPGVTPRLESEIAKIRATPVAGGGIPDLKDDLLTGKEAAKKGELGGNAVANMPSETVLNHLMQFNGKRVRLTNSTGFSQTGLITTHPIPGREITDVRLNGRGFSHDSVAKIEVLEKGRYKDATPAQALQKTGGLSDRAALRKLLDEATPGRDIKVGDEFTVRRMAGDQYRVKREKTGAWGPELTALQTDRLLSKELKLDAKLPTINAGARELGQRREPTGVGHSAEFERQSAITLSGGIKYLEPKPGDDALIARLKDGSYTSADLDQLKQRVGAAENPGRDLNRRTVLNNLAIMVNDSRKRVTREAPLGGKRRSMGTPVPDEVIGDYTKLNPRHAGRSDFAVGEIAKGKGKEATQARAELARRERLKAWMVGKPFTPDVGAGVTLAKDLAQAKAKFDPVATMLEERGFSLKSIGGEGTIYKHPSGVEFKIKGDHFTAGVPGESVESAYATGKLPKSKKEMDWAMGGEIGQRIRDHAKGGTPSPGPKPDSGWYKVGEMTPEQRATHEPIFGSSAKFGVWRNRKLIAAYPTKGEADQHVQRMQREETGPTTPSGDLAAPLDAFARTLLDRKPQPGHTPKLENLPAKIDYPNASSEKRQKYQELRSQALAASGTPAFAGKYRAAVDVLNAVRDEHHGLTGKPGGETVPGGAGDERAQLNATKMRVYKGEVARSEEDLRAAEKTGDEMKIKLARQRLDYDRRYLAELRGKTAPDSGVGRITPGAAPKPDELQGRRRSVAGHSLAANLEHFGIAKDSPLLDNLRGGGWTPRDLDRANGFLMSAKEPVGTGEQAAKQQAHDLVGYMRKLPFEPHAEGTHISNAESVSVTDTAKLVRDALKRKYPDTKFSVKSDKYSMGASIDVSYKDGPPKKEVDAFVGRYSSKGAMDNTDYSPDIHHVLTTKPDGSHEIKPYKEGEKLGPNDKIVRFGAHYVNAQREGSPEKIATGGASEPGSKTPGGWTLLRVGKNGEQHYQRTRPNGQVETLTDFGGGKNMHHIVFAGKPRHGVGVRGTTSVPAAEGARLLSGDTPHLMHYDGGPSYDRAKASGDFKVGEHRLYNDGSTGRVTKVEHKGSMVEITTRSQSGKEYTHRGKATTLLPFRETHSIAGNQPLSGSQRDSTKLQRAKNVEPGQLIFTGKDSEPAKVTKVEHVKRGGQDRIRIETDHPDWGPAEHGADTPIVVMSAPKTPEQKYNETPTPENARAAEKALDAHAKKAPSGGGADAYFTRSSTDKPSEARQHLRLANGSVEFVEDGKVMKAATGKHTFESARKLAVANGFTVSHQPGSASAHNTPESVGLYTDKKKPPSDFAQMSDAELQKAADVLDTRYEGYVQKHDTQGLKSVGIVRTALSAEIGRRRESGVVRTDLTLRSVPLEQHSDAELEAERRRVKAEIETGHDTVLHNSYLRKRAAIQGEIDKRRESKPKGGFTAGEKKAAVRDTFRDKLIGKYHGKKATIDGKEATIVDNGNGFLFVKADKGYGAEFSPETVSRIMVNQGGEFKGGEPWRGGNPVRAKETPGAWENNPLVRKYDGKKAMIDGKPATLIAKSDGTFSIRTSQGYGANYDAATIERVMTNQGGQFRGGASVDVSVRAAKGKSLVGKEVSLTRKVPDEEVPSLNNGHIIVTGEDADAWYGHLVNNPDGLELRFPKKDWEHDPSFRPAGESLVGKYHDMSQENLRAQKTKDLQDEMQRLEKMNRDFPDSLGTSATASTGEAVRRDSVRRDIHRLFHELERRDAVPAPAKANLTKELGRVSQRDVAASKAKLTDPSYFSELGTGALRDLKASGAGDAKYQAAVTRALERRAKSVPSAPKHLTTFDRHQISVARRVLATNPAIGNVMGGISRQEAIDIITRLTGKRPIDPFAKIKEAGAKDIVCLKLRLEEAISARQAARGNNQAFTTARAVETEIRRQIKESGLDISEASVKTTSKPWDGSAGRFTDAQYQASSLIDRGPQAGTIKERCSLPVLEPDGTLNVNALGAAAGRLNQLKNVTPAAKTAAAAKLARLRVQAGVAKETPEIQKLAEALLD